ncbi:hypothetical protein GCM10007928_52630 [Sulfitobacter porphyrae]|nr:hypothetical protein GCM10007928_52630 [Sulfitobacter porphyrae]
MRECGGGTRHTQEELKVPRVPWDLKGAGLFLSWGDMENTWGMVRGSAAAEPTS